MKYEQQLPEIKSLLNSSQNIVIALPTQLSTDELAAGLSLFLSLQAFGKKVSIVSDATLKVSDSKLYGIGEVKNEVKYDGGGNFVISLEGVVDAASGKPPALEKLDWFPEGQNLNLVFHVLPGQRFVPTNISSKHQEGDVNLVFVLGAGSLTELGGVYQNNPTLFNQTTVINIDNQNNANFGKVNLVDSAAATLCEVVAQILHDLGLLIDGDIGTNLLAGIYDATGNLTGQVSPETFIAIGTAMQSGGKLPQLGGQQTVMVNQPVSQVTTEVQSVPLNSTVNPQIQSQPVSRPQQPQNSGLDLSQIFQVPASSLGSQVQQPVSDNFITPPVVDSQQQTQPVSSPEERPVGEYVTNPSPEMDSNPTPDWLAPKIFKGGSIG